MIPKMRAVLAWFYDEHFRKKTFGLPAGIIFLLLVPFAAKGVELPEVFGGLVHPHWNTKGTSFWYESFGEDWSRQFWIVDAISGQKRSAFDHDKLVAALKKKGYFIFDPRFIPVSEIAQVGETQLELTIGALKFVFDTNTADIKLVDTKISAPRPLPRLTARIPSRPLHEVTTVQILNPERLIGTLWSLDENDREALITPIPVSPTELKAYVGNVFLVKDASGHATGIYQAAADPSQIVVSSAVVVAGEGQSLPYATESPNGELTATFTEDEVRLFDGERHEQSAYKLDNHIRGELITDHRFFSWSPDSSKLVVVQNVGSAKWQWLVQSSPASELIPKLVPARYCRPTDDVITERVHLIDSKAKKEITLPEELAEGQYYLRDVIWDSQSTAFLVSVVNRENDNFRVFRVDSQTGKLATLINERTKTFIDTKSTEKYRLFEVHGSQQFILTTEADGWLHAYLYDSETGKLVNRITSGSWVIREISSIFPEKKSLWFKAGGLVPGEDPYNEHLCSIHFDGSGFRDMTPADGSHHVEFTDDGKYYLDTYSRVDLPPITELRNGADSSKICEVEAGQWSAREKAGWTPPERFVAKGRDGQTDIYGVIYRPVNFDVSRKYPVVENIYAGPAGINVPKEFFLDSRETELASAGFIVVQCDGMGTNFRSKAFHDVCWHNLADAGIPDRIAWIKAAASKFPQMDLTRVGIYGGSEGGGNAVRALESHGDFYKVAVAECGTYDDRQMGSAEYWMGWPVSKLYEEQSDIHDAGKLKGRLMLLVEELDRTVDPSSTMQLANALINANKNFELVVIPNADHGQCGVFGNNKRRDFFANILLQK